jgi:hypothetical protein
LLVGAAPSPGVSSRASAPTGHHPGVANNGPVVSFAAPSRVATAVADGNDLLPRRPVASAVGERASGAAEGRDLLPRRADTPPRSAKRFSARDVLTGRMIAVGGAVVVLVAGGWFLFGRTYGSTRTPSAAEPSAKTGTTMSAAERAIADRAVETDLRNALSAEKLVYTDRQAYDGSASALQAIDPKLDWGRRLHVIVGDAATRGDRSIVCLSETSRSGAILSLADVALGPNTGTYFGTRPCPSPVTGKGVAALGTSLRPRR